MSWLVSLVLAGMMFTTQSGFPLQNNGINYNESNQTQVVRLDETERFEQTYTLNPDGKVSVSNINGSITIEAWDRNEVKLVAIKTAETRERLSQIQIKINSRPDRLDVETDLDAGRNGNWGRDYGKIEVEYQLTVPRTAILDEIEAVNGSIVVSNMTNFTKVSAVNGTVRASNLRGTANLSTVNGTVDADFSNLQTGSQISLSTVNGRANLLIPSDANATIKADSVNGNIVNDFGLPVRKGQYVGRDLHGRVGNGDVRIKLESVNGDLLVKRKQDGKTLNPATNLLNMNSDAEDDDDAGVVKAKSEVKAAKLKNKVIAPGQVYVQTPEVAIPEINVDMQKEIARAQRDVARAQVNINRDLINQQVQESLVKQRAALDRLKNINWVAGSPAIEKKSESFSVKGVPKVMIDAENCSVSVRGWDKSEVSYSVVKFSRMPNTVPIEVNVEHTDSEVHIKVPEAKSAVVGAVGGNVTVGTRLPNGAYILDTAPKMRIEVYVPKKSNLRIHSDNEIRLENVSGELDVRSNGGEAINVRDSDGTLKVANDDGRIRVIGFRGILDAYSSGGNMNLEGDFQDFSARTEQGTIILTLPNNTNASFQTDTDLLGEGFNLVHNEDKGNLWQIGKGGGKPFRLFAGDGRIVVRSSNEMVAVTQ